MQRHETKSIALTGKFLFLFQLFEGCLDQALRIKAGVMVKKTPSSVLHQLKEDINLWEQ